MRNAWYRGSDAQLKITSSYETVNQDLPVQIWTHFHWFVDYRRRTHPVEAGICDMNRYKKVADLTADESG